VRKHSQFIEGKPTPKGRPRMTKTGHVYTPESTRRAEAAVRAAYSGPKFEGLVSVILSISKDGVGLEIHELTPDNKSDLRGDLDNYAKTVLDALNGVAWEDDKQVTQINMRKY
jgi:crossover junction endodeoxyribonuclease RusA